jgi:hypothetical protein
MLLIRWTALVAAAALVSASPASAGSFFFSTGPVNNLIATASRPGPASGVNQETESADDFVLTSRTIITGASFTGLLPAGVSLGDISQVRVEIYRVFPLDSDTSRTPNVNTRVNSPSDVEFADRDTASGNLAFTASVLQGTFSALNSVDTGIHPKPNQFTMGDGPVSGQEVQFDVSFTTPFDLDPDHYFFVPQVLLSDPDGHFLWLSASRPIVPPGTPFPPGFTDLQSWIRNADLDPDWSRIGTDITGQGPFNAAFSLSGDIVPEPASLTLLATGGLGLIVYGWRRRRAGER